MRRRSLPPRFVTKDEEKQTKAYTEAKKTKVKENVIRMFGGLDTPIKRIGVVIFAVGALIVLLMSFAVFVDSPRWNRLERILEYWKNAATFNRRGSLLTSLGFYAVIVGLILSAFYDKTLGPLYRWIAGKQ